MLIEYMQYQTHTFSQKKENKFGNNLKITKSCVISPISLISN